LKIKAPIEINKEKEKTNINDTNIATIKGRPKRSSRIKGELEKSNFINIFISLKNNNRKHWYKYQKKKN